jgi:hypothetical protein
MVNPEMGAAEPGDHLAPQPVSSAMGQAASTSSGVNRLHPPMNRHVIDGDTSFCQQFFNVPV